jgi:hypothetical protein
MGPGAGGTNGRGILTAPRPGDLTAGLPLLGTMIESALTFCGVTKERVERWLGGPCGCKERKERLDALWRWAFRVDKGKTDNARRYLETVIGQGQEQEQGKGPGP